MTAIDPSNMTPEQKKQALGQCNFLWLATLTAIAFICGIYSTSYCSFVTRNLTLSSNYLDTCAGLGIAEDQCMTLTKNHGVGFFGWQTTVPVDQTVCLGYTQYIQNVGYVTPWFDSNFNTAVASAYMANIFGGIAFFTLWLASCCPMSQSRLKGLSCNYFIATLFQGLTLLIFQSNVCSKGFYDAYFQGTDDSSATIVENVTCGLDTGSRLAITATVFYFWCMFAVHGAIVPKPIGMRGGDEDPEVAEEINA